MAQVYQDSGYSGDSEYRPAFKTMLKDAKTGAFDIIVAWNEDRLTRGSIPYAAIEKALKGTSVVIHTRNGPVDDFAFAILAAVGKKELQQKSIRSKMGHRGRAKKGLITGPAKYGYRIGEDGKPVIQPAEAEIVRSIFGLYLGGMSTGGVADYLNQQGVPGPGGKDWWPT